MAPPPALDECNADVESRSQASVDRSPRVFMAAGARPPSLPAAAPWFLRTPQRPNPVLDRIPSALASPALLSLHGMTPPTRADSTDSTDSSTPVGSRPPPEAFVGAHGLTEEPASMEPGDRADRFFDRIRPKPFRPRRTESERPTTNEPTSASPPRPVAQPASRKSSGDRARNPKRDSAQSFSSYTYGRHSNTWLFGGFSFREQARELWHSTRKPSEAETDN